MRSCHSSTTRRRGVAAIAVVRSSHSGVTPVPPAPTPPKRRGGSVVGGSVVDTGSGVVAFVAAASLAVGWFVPGAVTGCSVDRSCASSPPGAVITAGTETGASSAGCSSSSPERTSAKMPPTARTPTARAAPAWATVRRRLAERTCSNPRGGRRLAAGLDRRLGRERRTRDQRDRRRGVGRCSCQFISRWSAARARTGRS